jgi:hypothetical protein
MPVSEPVSRSPFALFLPAWKCCGSLSSASVLSHAEARRKSPWMVPSEWSLFNGPGLSSALGMEPLVQRPRQEGPLRNRERWDRQWLDPAQTSGRVAEPAPRRTLRSCPGRPPSRRANRWSSSRIPTTSRPLARRSMNRKGPAVPRRVEGVPALARDGRGPGEPESLLRDRRAVVPRTPVLTATFLLRKARGKVQC